ncbi:MAG: hypothetical protein LWY06_07765 [Firmicutes bacterium]|nr:hypothetical protein [Bacillota bacterium]
MKKIYGPGNPFGIKGYTLIEFMVSSFVFLGVLTLTYFGWSATSKNFDNLESNVYTRQYAKLLSDHLQRDVASANYVYAGRTVTLKGHTYNLPATGTTGSELLIAIPENGNTGSITYTIVGYYPVRNSKDPVNPNSYKLIRQEVKNVTPATADSPPTVNFAAIPSASVSERIAADFIDISQFTIGENSGSIKAYIATAKKEKSSSMTDKTTLNLTVMMRNK